MRREIALCFEMMPKDALPCIYLKITKETCGTFKTNEFVGAQAFVSQRPLHQCMKSDMQLEIHRSTNSRRGRNIIREIKRPISPV